MKRRMIILFSIVCLVIGAMPVKAQIAGQERVAEIRKMYADAKKRMDANDKHGNPALDMTITYRDVVLEEEGYTEEDERTYYFDHVREYKDDQFYEKNVPFFIIRDWSAVGHTSYTEMMLNPKSGKLVFYFNRTETHAGLVTETRYYYDDNGKLIEQKHKSGNEEHLADVEPEADQNGTEEVKICQSFIEQFNLAMNQEEVEDRGNNATLSTTPKADRLNNIRSAYAKAKEKIKASETRSDLPRDIVVVIHDQEEGDCPPTTFVLNCWFDELKTGEHTHNNAYFISSRYYFMGFDNYNEYLIDPESQRLMFTYNQGLEENEKMEWRYYFDENGKCIETKTNTEEQDNGAEAKQTFVRYMKLFNILANGKE